MASETVVKGVVNKDIKMTGKTVLITGANTGLGLMTAIDMAKRGARVIMTSRNVEKGSQARDKVIAESGSDNDNVILKELDLCSFESVRKCASEVNAAEERLDVLVNNAGVMMCPKGVSKDGYELQMATNHLGHFLLTNLLVDLMKKSSPSRIVHVSSSAHYPRSGTKIYWDDLNLDKEYTPLKAYGQSKLMNVLFSRELSKRLQGTGVTSYSLEPGWVRTDLQRHIGTHQNPTFTDRVMTFIMGVGRPFWKSAEYGAQTQIYCAVAPELEKETGKYYSDCKVANESDDAKNDEYASRLWDLSVKMTGLSEQA